MFEESLKASSDAETEEALKSALDEVASIISPKHALETQKRYLRYGMKKPHDMGDRRLETRLNELFDQLKEIPMKNGIEPTSIPDDEWVNCVFRSLPKNWQARMEEKPAFDLSTSTFQEVLEYANRLEVNEDRESSSFSCSTHTNGGDKPAKHGHNAKSGKSDKRARFELSQGNNDGSHSKNKKHKSDYCMVHGTGHNHDSDACKILKAHAEKVRAQWNV